jgi:hypothetical protein
MTRPAGPTCVELTPMRSVPHHDYLAASPAPLPYRPESVPPQHRWSRQTLWRRQCSPVRWSGHPGRPSTIAASCHNAAFFNVRCSPQVNGITVSDIKSYFHAPCARLCGARRVTVITICRYQGSTCTRRRTTAQAGASPSQVVGHARNSPQLPAPGAAFHFTR